MASQSSGRDPVEKLAEEFADRFRRGERPSLAEYTARYPELADQIRELFPALVEMEQLASVDEPHTGPNLAGAGSGGPPQQLGEYRILREIGHGGMGVVYEAVQESLGRHVALKVLPLHGLLSPTHRERFRREAKAAARLHHTNIVPVFGVGEDNGIHYYAMQFIEGHGLDLVLEEVRRLRAGPATHEPATGAAGRDLSECVARGLLTGHFPRLEPDAAALSAAATAPPPGAAQGCSPSSAPQVRASDGSTVNDTASRFHLSSLPESQYFRSVAQVGVQVAEALAYAHGQGIMHRDIKPSNLLLDTAGRVWLTDFGLAKAGDNDDLTHTGDIVGTLRFLAPERLEGRCDVRSEVYSLGVTLYEMLTLCPAFAATDRMALLEQVRTGEPLRPGKCDPRIPRDLETIVLKAMAKNPADRYGTAQALAEDLRRFLAGAPVRARRIGLGERVLKWVKRRPAAAALMAVSGMAVLALVGLAVGLWYNGQLSAALREADKQRNRFEDLEARTRYLRNISQAEQAWQEARIVQTLRLLDMWRPNGADEPDLRGWEWYYLRGLCYKDFRTLEMNEVSERYSVAFHPDSRRIAVADWNRKIHVWDVVDGRKLHTLQGHSARVNEVAFSPDGSQLASASWDNTVRLWDVASGQEIKRLQGHNGVNSVAFSPDGRYLASAGGDKVVLLWCVARGKEVRRLLGHTAPVMCVTFSPDGRYLASCGLDRTARLWDATSGKALQTFSGHAHQVSSVAFSPDGRTLATSSEDHTIKLWDTDTGKLRVTLEGHTAWAFRVAFSPDGRWLASVSADMTVRLWDVISNKEVRVFRGHEGHFVGGLAFSPDGRFLATANWSNKVKVWDLASGPQEYRLLHPGHVDRVGGVAFSADGRRLASASRDRTVRLWDIASGRIIRILTGHRDEVRCVAFGAEDTLLATGSYDGTVKLWDPDTGRLRQTLTGKKGLICCVAVSPDGRRVAATDQAETGTVIVWEVATGRKLQTLVGHSAVAFSPDGRRLAFPSKGKTVKLWDTETWQELRTLEGFKEGVYTVAFSPDGSLLAAAGHRGEDGVKLWDPVSGELIRTLEGLWGHIHSVVFSPDGRRVAAAGEDGKVKLWDTGTSQEVLTLKGPTGMIYSIAFSPDGRWLASSLGLLWEAPPDGRTEPQDRAALLTPEYVLRWHLNEAEDCLKAGQRSAALWHVNRLGQPRLNDPLLYTRLAAIREQFGLWNEALADTEAALREQRDDPTARFLRGQACQKLGRHAEAVADFTAALTHFPRYAPLYQLRAASQHALGKLELAKADREKAIKLGGPDSMALNNQAWQLVTGPMGKRDPIKALDLILQAIKQEPNDATLLNTLGVVQYRNGKYKEAVATLEKSLAAGQGKSDAFDQFFLAMCHHHLGNAAKAKDCFDRAVKWCQGQKNLLAQNAEELKAFQAEAEVLLGRGKP
jgi:WD40 repeat protein/serine/threonine protein kinase/tetratricopeptide (TPR) repeat protein